MLYIPLNLLDHLAESYINSRGAHHLHQYDIKKTYQALFVMLILKEWIELAKLKDKDVENILISFLKSNMNSEEYLSLINQAQNTKQEVQSVTTADALLSYEDKIEILKLLFELKPVLIVPLDYDKLLIRAATILKCKKQDFITLKNKYK